MFQYIYQSQVAGSSPKGAEKRCNGERRMFFTPKNTKSPWKTRTWSINEIVLRTVKSSALPQMKLDPFARSATSLGVSPHHWCEASHRLRLAASSFARSATSFICAVKWETMFSLRSKWCWPTVKWCCALRHKWKILVPKNEDFWVPPTISNLKPRW